MNSEAVRRTGGRFPRMVAEAVRRAVGPEFLLDPVFMFSWGLGLTSAPLLSLSFVQLLSELAAMLAALYFLRRHSGQSAEKA